MSSGLPSRVCKAVLHPLTYGKKQHILKKYPMITRNFGNWLFYFVAVTFLIMYYKQRRNNYVINPRFISPISWKLQRITNIHPSSMYYHYLCFKIRTASTIAKINSHDSDPRGVDLCVIKSVITAVKMREDRIHTQWWLRVIFPWESGECIRKGIYSI